jgi:hypothetical protein
VQVSVDGGAGARWIKGGREIVYTAANGALETAAVTTSPVFAVQSRTSFFAGAVSPELIRGADVSADGQHVVLIKPSDEVMKVLVVLNWIQELRERLRR